MPKHKNPTGCVPMISCVASDILLYLGWSKNLKKPLMKILNKVKCPIYALNGVEVYKQTPRTLRSQKNSQKKEESFKSFNAPAGQGVY
jgi:hypothetical protein